MEGNRQVYILMRTYVRTVLVDIMFGTDHPEVFSKFGQIDLVAQCDLRAHERIDSL